MQNRISRRPAPAKTRNAGKKYLSKSIIDPAEARTPTSGLGIFKKKELFSQLTSRTFDSSMGHMICFS
jgi:hypothetical protein